MAAVLYEDKLKEFEDIAGAWEECMSKTAEFGNFGIEIENVKKQSVESRKKLSERTKEIKKKKNIFLKNSESNNNTGQEEENKNHLYNDDDKRKEEEDGEAEERRKTEECESKNVSCIAEEKSEEKTKESEEKIQNNNSNNVYVNEVFDLIKSYQNEIDFLTRRAKNAEMHFLQILQILYDAPDVGVHLKSAINEIKTVEKENQQNKEKVDEFKKLLQENDVQIFQMQTQIFDLTNELNELRANCGEVKKLESEIESLNENFKKKMDMQAAQNKNAQKQMAMQLREEHEKETYSLRQKMEELTKKNKYLETLSTQHDSQILKVKTEYEQRIDAKFNEMETLNEEIERLKKINFEMQKKIEASSNDTPATHLTHLSMHAPGGKGEKQIEILREELLSVSQQYEDYKTLYKNSLEEKETLKIKMEEEKEGLTKKLKSLQDELKNRPTQEEVEKLRRRIRNEEICDVCDIEGASSELEKMLIKKIQDIEGKTAAHRVELQEKEKTIGHLTNENSKLNEKVNNLSTLISKLEDELELQDAAFRSNKLSSSGAVPLKPFFSHITGGGGTGVSGILRRGDLGTDNETRKFVGEEGEAILGQGLMGGVESGAGGGRRTLSAEVSEGKDNVEKNNLSMLDIVMAQRDRIRQKLLEIEQERDEWKNLALNEKQVSEKLYSDNISLVERMKFVESSWGGRNSTLNNKTRGSGSGGAGGVANMWKKWSRGRTKDAGGHACENDASSFEDLEAYGRSDNRNFGGKKRGGDDGVVDRYIELYEKRLNDEVNEMYVDDEDHSDKNSGNKSSRNKEYEQKTAQNSNGKYRYTAYRNNGNNDDMYEYTNSANEDAASGGAMIKKVDDRYTQFKKVERMRKLKGMALPERLLVMWGMLLLSTRPTRIFTIGYIVSIHLIIICTILKCAELTSHSQNNPHLDHFTL